MHAWCGSVAVQCAAHTSVAAAACLANAHWCRHSASALQCCSYYLAVSCMLCRASVWCAAVIVAAPLSSVSMLAPPQSATPQSVLEHTPAAMERITQLLAQTHAQEQAVRTTHTHMHAWCMPTCMRAYMHVHVHTACMCMRCVCSTIRACVRVHVHVHVHVVCFAHRGLVLHMCVLCVDM